MSTGSIKLSKIKQLERIPSQDHHVLVRGSPVAMSVMKLWSGSVIPWGVPIVYFHCGECQLHCGHYSIVNFWNLISKGCHLLN